MRRVRFEPVSLAVVLSALLLAGIGCEQGQDQDFWSVEGHVRDLSGNPIEGATVGVDIDRPEMECGPIPEWWLCGFERDFYVSSDADGRFFICLEAADVRTTIVVEKPGYSAPRPFADFSRSEEGPAVESRDFWLHGGAFHTIEGYVRHPDGSPLTEWSQELELRETQGRWWTLDWTDSGHYVFQVPDCGLTFDVMGPQGCTGSPQVRRYEGVDRDYYDQDFTLGCPGVEAEEYAVYSTVIRREFPYSPKLWPDQFVIESETGTYPRASDLPVALVWVQGNLPGVTDEMVVDFTVRNIDAYPLESRFTVGSPVVLLSQEQWEEILAQGGWDEFYGRYPGCTGFITLSRVAFSASGDKALVYMGYLCQSLCGMGTYYLLLKQGDAWSVDGSVMIWVS